ncbi:MAG TPA: acyl carrier protein [Ignavibacteria bacterium]|nr:acyl carrier protein [Ignavibacteria bacterium]
MKLEEVIKESFSLSPENQKDEIKFTELEDWDSLAHMFFVTKIEENFNVNFDGEEIANIKTISDLKKILTSKGVTF